MSIKSELTILTAPIPEGSDAMYQRLYLVARRINYWRKGQQPPKYGGHYAVTRSLIEGMTKAGLPFNYNPRILNQVADRVHVFGVQALKQMIKWKTQGLVKQLTCGPNVVVRSSEFNSILASPEIDAVVNHTDWACDFWAIDHPELRNRCLRWAAGVDSEFWMLKTSDNPRDRILVFDKRSEYQNPERVGPYVEYLQSSGWPVDVLTRCGKKGYTLERYRELLNRASLMVGFTVGSESQGIAWAEAWAANVPTLILQQTENVYQGLRYRCNTAPFLSPATGAFFSDFDDFKRQFEKWKIGKYAFRPRDWVLTNMTDQICASDLYEKLMNLPSCFLTMQKAQIAS